jgi:hypothetical protein
VRYVRIQWISPLRLIINRVETLARNAFMRAVGTLDCRTAAAQALDRLRRDACGTDPISNRLRFTLWCSVRAPGAERQAADWIGRKAKEALALCNFSRSAPKILRRQSANTAEQCNGGELRWIMTAPQQSPDEGREIWNILNIPLCQVFSPIKA